VAAIMALQKELNQFYDAPGDKLISKR